MAWTSKTCPTSLPLKSTGIVNNLLAVSPGGVSVDMRTPTLTRQGASGSSSRSPLLPHRSSSRNQAPGPSSSYSHNTSGLLQVPPMVGHLYKRPNHSSPRTIQDRLIPCRSQTDIQLAQHLLSPLSAPLRPNGSSSKTGSNGKQSNSSSHHQQMVDEDVISRNQVTRILNFGSSPSGGASRRKPLSVVTHPSSPSADVAGNGRSGNKPGKVKFPIKPDRIMAAPGTFLDCGSQSAHWAPSSNLVVALESGVYYCKINDDCRVFELRNNTSEPQNPFCHVVWNPDGNVVVCGKMSGQVHLCDVRQLYPRCMDKGLDLNHLLRSVAFDQDHLLTCGGVGVRIYDVRLVGSVQQREPVVAFKGGFTVNSVSWSPNGHLLAGGCENGVTYLWDIRHADKEMATLKQQEKNPIQVVRWCSWKPSILLTGSSFPHPSVCAHNTAMGVMLNQVDCASEVTGIEFNSQLKQVTTSHHSIIQDMPVTETICGKESTVQLWQLSSHKLSPLAELGQHEEGIVAMASSVNGHQLLTMGGDELLCLWQWSETKPQITHRSGSLSARSLLDPVNLLR